MDTIFLFSSGRGQLTAINLYKVAITVEPDKIVLSEQGCDLPTHWEVYDDGDIALLRSWLVSNALGGERLIQGRNQ